MKKAALNSMMLLLLGASTAMAQPGTQHGAQRATGQVPGDMNRFAELDPNGDGKVTRAEWISKHEERFNQADANKDGQLSKDERERAHMARREARFRRFDKNGDGKVTNDEAADLPKHFFVRKDKNHDGAITRDEAAQRGGHGAHRRGHCDDADGAEQSLAITRERMRSRAAERFARVDGNGDGIVTADELGHRGHGKFGKRGAHR